jgi:hypothetical protein
VLYTQDTPKLGTRWFLALLIRMLTQQNGDVALKLRKRHNEIVFLDKMLYLHENQDMDIYDS